MYLKVTFNPWAPLTSRVLNRPSVPGASEAVNIKRWQNPTLGEGYFTRVGKNNEAFKFLSVHLYTGLVWLKLNKYRFHMYKYYSLYR